MAGPLPPAAWYPDPHVPGLLRWWDGNTWTAHTHPTPTAQLVTTVADQPRTEPHQTDVAGAAVLSAQAYGTHVWLNGEAITIDATSAVGHGALGATRRVIPRCEIRSVTLDAPSLMANGRLTVVDRHGQVVVHFRREHAAGIQAIHRALTSASDQVMAPVARHGAQPPAGHTKDSLSVQINGTLTGASRAPSPRPARIEPATASRLSETPTQNRPTGRVQAPERRTTRWFAPDETVRVESWDLPGMVYVGRDLPAVSGNGPDPALIDPRLRINSRHPDLAGSCLHYWPSYADISPEGRAAYLRWHAGGRQDPGTRIGYVFLFFYGLERRVLGDAAAGDPAATAELPRIGAEVERLLSIYGGQSSFHGYARGFLNVLELIALSPAEVAAGVPPPVPDSRWPVSMRLRIGLGEIVRAGRPVPADWALTWALSHPQIYPRTPATRCGAEFARLFELRYHQRHGQGLVIRAPKSRLRWDYHPASGGFAGQSNGDMADVPDVVELAAPTKSLTELVTSCTDDLDAYSRWLGRNPHGRGTLAATALLPPELLTGSGAELDGLTGWIEGRLGDDQQVLVDGGDLLAHWTAPGTGGGTGKTTKRDAIAFTQLLSSCGYGLEPDPRLGGPIPGPGPVVIFRHGGDRSDAASAGYRAATTMLHLAAAVAAADGHASEAEQRSLLAHLEHNLNLTAGERTRLRAHLCWLITSGVKLTGVNARIAALTDAQKRSVGELLVEVAAADGVIEPDEVTMILKIYRLLGLDPDTAYGALHSAAGHSRPAATEPVVVRPGAPGTTDYAIPQPPHATSPSARAGGRHAATAPAPPGGAIYLDPALIEAKLAETSAVTSLLSEIFTDDPDGPAPQPAPTHDARTGGDTAEHAEAPAPAPSSSGTDAAGVAGLDATHSHLLRALSERGEWPRADFEALTAAAGVLPDSALDLLNEAAYEHAGEPVVEGDDPLFINTDTAQELLA